jgi:hypothetical protein
MRVVEAGEDEAPITGGNTGDVVDEVSGGRAQTCAWSLFLESAQKPVQAFLGLCRVLRSIGALGVGVDLVGHAAQDLQVAVDAARRPDAVPVGLQRCIELVEVEIRTPFFSAAS